MATSEISPGLIPRQIPEIALGFMTICMGAGIAAHGDIRFSYYLMEHGIASLETVRLVWGIAFGIAGLMQLIGVFWCNRRGGIELMCTSCPFRKSCKAWRLRRVSAFLSALAWGWLFIVMLKANPEFVSIWTIPVVAVSQAIIFSILRPAAIWKPL